MRWRFLTLEFNWSCTILSLLFWLIFRRPSPDHVRAVPGSTGQYRMWTAGIMARRRKYFRRLRKLNCRWIFYNLIEYKNFFEGIFILQIPKNGLNTWKWPYYGFLNRHLSILRCDEGSTFLYLGLFICKVSFSLSMKYVLEVQADCDRHYRQDRDMMIVHELKKS